MSSHAKSVPPCDYIGRFIRQLVSEFAILALVGVEAALVYCQKFGEEVREAVCVANIPEHTRKNLEATVGPSFI